MRMVHPRLFDNSCPLNKRIHLRNSFTGLWGTKIHSHLLFINIVMDLSYCSNAQQPSVSLPESSDVMHQLFQSQSKYCDEAGAEKCPLMTLIELLHHTCSEKFLCGTPKCVGLNVSVLLSNNQIYVNEMSELRCCKFRFSVFVHASNTPVPEHGAGHYFRQVLSLSLCAGQE